MQKRILIFSFLVLIFNKLSYLVLLRYQKIGDVEHVLNQVNMIVSSYGTLKKTSKSERQQNQLKILVEADYCQRSDLFKYYHPDITLEDIHLMRDADQGLVRQIVSEKTFLQLPNVKNRRNHYKEQPVHKFPLQISQFFNYHETIRREFKAGESALCLFQIFNHMVGKSQLAQKQNLMNNNRHYMEEMKKKNISQKCLDDATIFPPSYRLYKTNECLEFFSMVQDEKFLKKNRKVPQYILKLGNFVHRGRGIDMLFPDTLSQIEAKYNRGEQCGIIKTHLIAQKYISNPFLYKNHKIEFRIYWFVASTDPLIVYSYQRPLIKRCAKEFNITSLEKAVHVCNTAIVKKSIENQPQKEKEVQQNFEQDIDFDFGQQYNTDKSKADNDNEQSLQEKIQNKQLKKGSNVENDKEEDEDEVEGDKSKPQKKDEDEQDLENNQKNLDIDVKDDWEDDVNVDEQEEDQNKRNGKKIKKVGFKKLADDEDDNDLDKKKEDDEDEDDEVFRF